MRVLNKFVVGGAAVLRAVTAAAQTPVPVTLDIQLDKPLHKVSPMLYGLMTEEINFSYDGGLYAERVRNRTLGARSHAQPMHWFLVQEGNGSGTMTLDDTSGPSEALQNSLQVDVTQADARNPVGVYNDGYWGMAVRPNTSSK